MGHKRCLPVHGRLVWDVNNERWFRAEWVNLLKFRFSIGNPGNQNFDAYLSSGTYIYNTDYTNHFGTSAIIEKFANKNLAWQKTIDKNFGLDLEFFDSRLRLSGDYYHKVTDPLLVSVSMPPSVGLSSLYTNFGGQVSKGVNGTIMFNAIKRSDLRLNLNLNFRHGTTEYRNIGNKLDFLNEKGSGNSYRRYYDGGSPDDIWAVRSAGIDPATGREIFIKKDGTYTFQYDANDEVVVGSTASKLEGFPCTTSSSLQALIYGMHLVERYLLLLYITRLKIYLKSPCTIIWISVHYMIVGSNREIWSGLRP